MKTLISKIEAGMKDGAPRLHPNGFYTLDLSHAEKLHVWPERPVRTRTDGGFIHDHTFTFRSLVLVGTLMDTVFETRPTTAAGGYAMYHFPQPHGRTHLAKSKPRKDGARIEPMPTIRQKLGAGNAYAVPAGVFHRSDAVGFTATVLSIVDFADRKAEARVLIPPDHVLEDFDRTLGPGEEAAAGFDIGRVVNLLMKKQA